MGPNLAKRDSLGIDRNPSTVIGERIQSRVLDESSSKDITLAKLVRDLSDELACKPDKIVSEIIKLQSGNKILVREPSPYKGFSDYLLSPTSASFWELLVVTMVSAGLVLVSSGLALYLRYVFSSALVLFLPGYALIHFIYFKRAELSYLTLTSVSFVMSLAITTLVGLALSFTPFGITLPGVTLSIAALTIGLALLTSLRKYSNYDLNAMTEK